MKMGTGDLCNRGHQSECLRGMSPLKQGSLIAFDFTQFNSLPYPRPRLSPLPLHRPPHPPPPDQPLA